MVEEIWHVRSGGVNWRREHSFQRVLEDFRGRLKTRVVRERGSSGAGLACIWANTRMDGAWQTVQLVSGQFVSSSGQSMGSGEMGIGAQGFVTTRTMNPEVIALLTFVLAAVYGLGVFISMKQMN